MDNQGVFNTKSLKSFIKGSLVLIGLFAILYCGVIALFLTFDRNIDTSKSIENSKDIYKDNEVYKNQELSKKIVNKKRDIMEKNLDNKVLVLIYFLVLLPILTFLTIFLRFSCLVKLHYIKTTDSSDDNEGILLDMHDINALIEVYRKAIKVKNMIKNKVKRRYKCC